jgi:hypothetical protein
MPEFKILKLVRSLTNSNPPELLTLINFDILECSSDCWWAVENLLPMLSCQFELTSRYANVSDTTVGIGVSVSPSFASVKAGPSPQIAGKLSSFVSDQAKATCRVLIIKEVWQ